MTWLGQLVTVRNIGLADRFLYCLLYLTWLVPCLGYSAHRRTRYREDCHYQRFHEQVQPRRASQQELQFLVCFNTQHVPGRYISTVWSIAGLLPTKPYPLHFSLYLGSTSHQLIVWSCYSTVWCIICKPCHASPTAYWSSKFTLL